VKEWLYVKFAHEIFKKPLVVYRGRRRQQKYDLARILCNSKVIESRKIVNQFLYILSCVFIILTYFFSPCVIVGVL